MSVFSKLQPKKGADAIIRPLTLDDREALEALISADPVGFLYAAEHLALFGLPSPSALASLKSPRGFVGIFASSSPEALPGKTATVEQVPPVGEGLPTRLRGALETVVGKVAALGSGSAALHRGQGLTPASPVPGYAEVSAPVTRELRHSLVGALWLGSNCVPLAVPPEYERQTAAYIYKNHRRIGSIFGPQQPVMGLWSHLAQRMPTPFDIRENQPLLELATGHDLSGLAAQALHRETLAAPQLAGGVRWSRTSDRQSLLRASVAMFLEEVGYDPMTRDPVGYARRIDDLTRSGRTLVAVNEEATVVFKTDLGLAHGDTCQLQGVWLHPAYRHRGLAPVLLAQACQLIRSRFPRLSLYVNDYNRAARALYERTGWQQTATFATVLF